MTTPTTTPGRADAGAGPPAREVARAGREVHAGSRQEVLPSLATPAPLARGPVLIIALAVVAVLTALGTRLGYHRDEFYYLWGGDHLAWGFVDHPPAVPLVARLVEIVGGGSLLSLRLAAALVAGWLVVAGAFLARELGGGRTAQIVAAATVALIPATRTPEELFGTTAFDAAVWAAIFCLFARLLRSGSARWWVPIGVAAGIGLETKWSVLILLAGMAAGLVMSSERRLLRSPWLCAGVAIALVLWAPNLVWNATHSWPAIEFQRSIAKRNGTLDHRLMFFPMQLLLTSVTGVLVWGPGLWWLLRGPGRRRFRSLGIGALAMAAIVFFSGGKPYYLTPMYLVLVGAGGVALEAATRRRRRTTMVLVACGAALAIPLTLPVLPISSLDAVASVNPEMREMLGWPELVEQVTGLYRSIPPGERSRTVILASNYGEAGALTRSDPALPVYSAHNSFWYEGPPPPSATDVLTVGYAPATFDRWCSSVATLGTITNPYGLHNIEAGHPVLLCHGLRVPWDTAWAELRKFR